MSTKNKNTAYKGMGSRNTKNRAALEAAGMAKKTPAKKKASSAKKSAIDKGTRARIDAARKKYLEKAKKNPGKKK